MNNKNIAILAIGILVLAILVLVIFKGNDMWKWIKEKCCCFGKEERKEEKKEERSILSDDQMQQLNQQPKKQNEEAIRILNAQIEETKKLQESLQNMIAGTDRIEKIDNDIESSLKKTEELLTDFIVADAKATINKK